MKNKRKESQASKVKKYLAAGNSITPIDALSMFGCFRLSAIIYTLRQEGLPIETNFKTKNGKTFAEYELTYDKTV